MTRVNDAAHRAGASRLWLAAGGALGLAVATFVLLSVARGPDEAARPDAAAAGGTRRVEVTVARAGTTLYERAPLDDLGPLADGDRMMVSVRDGAGAFLRLEARDEGRWASVFDGRVPDDGDVPLTLTVTRGSETALRAALCDEAPPPGPGVFVAPGESCQVATWVLDVR